MNMFASPAPPSPDYARAAQVEAALAEPHRLSLLMLLSVRPACVCELVDLLPLSQPAVSQHLRRLREAGLLQEQKQGRFVVYALSDELPPHVQLLLASLPEPEGARRLHSTTLVAACELAPDGRTAP